MSSDEIIKKQAILKSDASKALSSLNKSEIIEIKAFKSPPSCVTLVGEASCLLFSMKPEYTNFKKLISTPNLIENFYTFDINNMSDYTLNKLKKYINDPNFNPDSMLKISKFSSILCKTIICFYEYALLQKQLEIINLIASSSSNSNNSSYSTLIDLIVNKSFYSFAWPCYFNDLYSADQADKIKELNSIINSTSNQISSFISLQDYLNIYSDSITNTNYNLLPNKILESNLTKGNYIIFNSNHIITDLNLFTNELNILINNGQLNSNDFDDLNKIIGKNVLLWREDDLMSSKLNLNYLIDLNLVLKMFDSNTNTNLIVPMLLLNQELNESKNNIWFKEWTGLEYKITWNLFCSISFNSFCKLVNIFYVKNWIRLIWSTGFIIKDSHCDVMLTYSDNKSIYIQFIYLYMGTLQKFSFFLLSNHLQ